MELICSDNQAKDLIDSIDWHSAYVQEVHLSPSQFLTKKEDGRTGSILNSSTILRLLIAVPAEDFSLELILIDPEVFTLLPQQELEDEQTITIRRRTAEGNFWAFQFKCACVAFQKLSLEAVIKRFYYTSDTLYDSNGSLLEPYNIDWRQKLDDAFAKR